MAPTCFLEERPRPGLPPSLAPRLLRPTVEVLLSGRLGRGLHTQPARLETQENHTRYGENRRPRLRGITYLGLWWDVVHMDHMEGRSDLRYWCEDSRARANRFSIRAPLASTERLIRD